MSEKADICLKPPSGWKRSYHSSSGSRKSSSNCIFNSQRRNAFYSLLNVHNRRQERNLIVIRNQLAQERRSHRQRIFVTFPLHLKLRFQRFRARGTQKTGYTGATKAYFCSVRKRSINEAGSNTGIDIHRFKQKMANTLSVMTNVLRNVVSKQRIRYKEKGFNLDLAYVCDNIIAMGYPAEKYESMYRNRLEDVYKFLEENHGDHYKIYNLCLERSYDINKFHGRVSVYPFEDHNPPTIELIQKFCEDVDAWLKADVLNVAAVHCKAGKGRTGTMICCYLLFSGQQRTAEDALSCYDEKRTKDRKGVTIPSQRRYVQYFCKLLRLGLPYERRTLQFCEIRFSEPKNMQIFGIVHCSISVLQDTGCAVKVQPLQNLLIDFRKTCVLDMKNPPFNVAGDIKVELTKNNKKVLHFWFNTFFVTDSAVIEGEGNEVKFVYTLQKLEIDDAHKDKEHKCFSEDFKVDLVFNYDENNVERDNMQVSSTNRLTSSNHQRGVSQCSATSLRLQQQPASAAAAASNTHSNSYSLPQNNSSGSEMNFLCDQNTSSSTSVSSSLGGGVTTDNSNGYESNVQQRSLQLRSSDVPSQQHFTNLHHSHRFAGGMQDVTSLVLTSPAQAPQPSVMAPQQAPPGFMLEHQYQQPQQQQQQQHKNNVHHVKGTPSVAATSTPNQRHILSRQSNTNVGCGGISNDTLPNIVDGVCRQPSGYLNAISSNTSYNHSTDSSKTSSVSSQSSSAIGDAEEDWESGESCDKKLDHITLLLSTSFVTTTPSAPQTQLLLPVNDPSKSDINTGIQKSSHFASTSTCTSSNSTSTSTSTSSNSTCSSSFTFTSKSPTNNKRNISSSICTNKVVVGGNEVDDNNDDVDDDEDDVNDDDCNKKDNVDNDNNLKAKSLNASSKNILKQNEHSTLNMTQASIALPYKPVEPNRESPNSSHSKTDEEPTTHVPPANMRPKLMHLLMAPKSQNNIGASVHQSPSHKPIFKRKSSHKITKTMPNAATGNNSSCVTIDADNVDPINSLSALVDPVVGSFSGVATTSKQKLKIKLKKNKLKLSQKFQWFQSYFRSDPVDFCENFVHQTTSMRRNSICSMASRTHKLSTTTPPSITPPLATEGSSSTEQLNDRGATSCSQSTSNASIATGDLCEDYYSYLCDNQLSFSNSPCKSPRSLADIASSINGVGGGGGGVVVGSSAGVTVSGGSFGSSFIKGTGVGHFRERRETMPGVSTQNGRRNNVVIVAAKPAKTHAIGFNVNSLNFDQKPPLARHDSVDIDTSPASIYNPPDVSQASNNGNNEKLKDNAGDVIPQSCNVATPQKPPESDSKQENDSGRDTPTAKPQSKYSLNLVIVKECPFESTTTSTCCDEFDESSKDISCVGEQSETHVMDDATSEDSQATVTASGVDDFLERKMTITTCPSVCSNSSSSGFGTSEGCTTNSSSSSCNCNPFAVVLERHNSLATTVSVAVESGGSLYNGEPKGGNIPLNSGT